MASVNCVILIGHLGKDPEVRFTPNGKAIAKFSLATTDITGSGDDRKTETDWHNIVVFGPQGENAGKYLAKGSQIYLRGRIKNRSYDDKDGNKRYITEIIAQEVTYLDKKPQASTQGSLDGFTTDTDDIPF